MNYLGLVGLLGLTGERDGPPVQSAGQIADIGGGALMAAFGILAALRERDRSGEGQLVDVSMADGSLSWLAMVAGRYFCDGVVPRRGDLELAGRLVCYRPYPCADGWVTLGRARAEVLAQLVCTGVGREDLIEKQFEAPGSDGARRGRARSSWSARASSGGAFAVRARLLPGAGARARRGARLRARPGARDGGRARPARRGQRAPARRAVKLSRTPGAVRAPGPVLGEHTGEVLASLGYSGRGDRGARGRGRRRGAGGRRARELHGMSAGRRRRSAASMSELAERVGRERRARSSTTCARACSAATPVRDLAQHGLLPARTSSSASALIKRLQEERFMPLRVIRGVHGRGPRAAAGAGRARGPHRSSARRPPRTGAASRAPSCAGATRSRPTCSTASRS